MRIFYGQMAPTAQESSGRMRVESIDAHTGSTILDRHGGAYEYGCAYGRAELKAISDHRSKEKTTSAGLEWMRFIAVP